MIELLTDRQKQVLECIANGCSNQEIAEELYISINTVRLHTSAIMTALNVDSRNKAAKIWWKCQINEIQDILRRDTNLSEDKIIAIFDITKP